MRRPPLARLLPLALSSSPLAHVELSETDQLGLVPPADRKALEEIPDIVHSTLEAVGTLTSRGGLEQPDRRASAVMYSAKIVTSLDGKAIRPGDYLVPLENDAKGRVTELLLAPYPGTCTHVSPPPPNQIVLVRYPQGPKLADIYTSLWVSGVLKIKQVSNDSADVAHTIDKAQVEVVEETDLQGRHLCNNPW